MISYLKKFSPVLSKLSEPLRRLCKSGVKWAWESEQQDAFEAIKQVMTTLPILTYFDKTKKHTIQCDASKKGLGAVLLQESKPVMYVSRGVYTRNRRFIKPDLTEAVPPEPEPEPRLRPLPPRRTRTIKRPDRLIESK